VPKHYRAPNPLEANGVSVADAEKGAPLLNGPDLADHARRFTVLVEHAR
jgi:hypothetical protein